MRLTIDHDFEQGLRNAQPTFYGKDVVHPPQGSLSAPKVIPPLTIPPLNTNINYSMVQPIQLSDHPGLMASKDEELPKEFNWREPFSHDTPEILKKKALIAKPGNQMLCGSCWAISGAELVGDNFVVSNVVDWVPNLSTTWSLVCYPQSRCKGGNPSLLFYDIARGGIATNHCIDYSWCAKNEMCNGKATKHFTKGIDMDKFLPTSCGCVENIEHYLYKIDSNIRSVFIGSEGVNEKNVSVIVKRKIYDEGPVLGSFLVFKNFMKGRFAHMNGGVYLEDGVYDDNEIKFDKDQTSAQNYAGAHAVAIIGWGIAKGIQTSKGKEDVPYWYCRNSWTEKWGDNGCFKMAMYPWNKRSVFDIQVQVNTPAGPVSTGGIVFISATQKPEKKTLKQLQKVQFDLLRDSKYYSDEQHDQGTPVKPKGGFGVDWLSILKILGIVVGVLVLLVLLFLLFRRFKLPSIKLPSLKGGGGGRSGVYRFEGLQ